jgi:hypothetical protein
MDRVQGLLNRRHCWATAVVEANCSLNLEDLDATRLLNHQVGIVAATKMWLYWLDFQLK